MSAGSGRSERLAVVPARGGSKRLPGKNTRPLAGRPMLAYTVDAALESGLFDRVVVSTDDPTIAEIARRCGAEVPFLREPTLSDDLSPVSLATVDALERLDPRGHFRHIAQLMPNCPLRNVDDVHQSYQAFSASGAMSQISVTRFGWQNPWWAVRRRPDGVLMPVFKEMITRRSQDLPELFCPTGAIWWATAETLRRERTYHVPGRTGWEIPWERGVDIDTADDWAWTELILTQTLLKAAPDGA
jgi:pseudaminic acid cytidylyltransferase